MSYDHKKPKEFKCDCEQCSKFFTRTEALRNHFLNVHEKRKLKCDSCGNLFTAKKSLNLHKKTVQEGHKDYKRGKSYSQAQNLRNHIRIVHDHERHY